MSPKNRGSPNFFLISNSFVSLTPSYLKTGYLRFTMDNAPTQTQMVTFSVNIERPGMKKVAQNNQTTKRETARARERERWKTE